MLNTCIAVTLIFLVIAGIRFLCRGRISNVVIYALWLVLAVRLIMPGVECVGTRLFGVAPLTMTSPFSVENVQYAVEKAWHQKMQERMQEEINQVQREETTNQAQQKNGQADRTATQIAERTGNQSQLRDNNVADTTDRVEQNRADAQAWSAILQGIFSKRTLYGIWLIGFVLILFYEIRMEKCMRNFLIENREQTQYRDVSIYQVKGIATPLLFRSKGTILDIYVPDELMVRVGYDEPHRIDSKCYEKAQEDRVHTAWLEHAILHENVHKQHGDIWWGYLRNLLVAVYWFHPVVWLAAILSKRDCEYACDDAVMKEMNETERIAYGNSLLMLVQVGSRDSVFLTATAMKMKTSEMRMRIQMIKNGIQKNRWLLGVVMLVVFGTGVAAFTQKTDSPKNSENRSDTQYDSEQRKETVETLVKEQQNAKELAQGTYNVSVQLHDEKTKAEELQELVGKEQQAAAAHSVPDWYEEWQNEHLDDDGMLAPEEIHDVQEIFLYQDNTTRSVRDADLLAIFEKAFSEPIEEIKGGSACPFTQTVYIRMGDGTCGKVWIATDSCSIYSDGEREYKYHEDVMATFWKRFGIYY